MEIKHTAFYIFLFCSLSLLSAAVVGFISFLFCSHSDISIVSLFSIIFFSFSLFPSFPLSLPPFSIDKCVRRTSLNETIFVIDPHFRMHFQLDFLSMLVAAERKRRMNEMKRKTTNKTQTSATTIENRLFTSYICIMR